MTRESRSLSLARERASERESAKRERGGEREREDLAVHFRDALVGILLVGGQGLRV